jgi:hypothetical protein
MAHAWPVTARKTLAIREKVALNPYDICFAALIGTAVIGHGIQGKSLR